MSQPAVFRELQKENQNMGCGLRVFRGGRFKVVHAVGKLGKKGGEVCALALSTVGKKGAPGRKKKKRMCKKTPLYLGEGILGEVSGNTTVSRGNGRRTDLGTLAIRKSISGQKNRSLFAKDYTRCSSCLIAVPIPPPEKKLTLVDQEEKPLSVSVIIRTTTPGGYLY